MNDLPDHLMTSFPAMCIAGVADEHIGALEWFLSLRHVAFDIRVTSGSRKSDLASCTVGFRNRDDRPGRIQFSTRATFSIAQLQGFSDGLPGVQGSVKSGGPAVLDDGEGGFNIVLRRYGRGVVARVRLEHGIPIARDEELAGVYTRLQESVFPGGAYSLDMSFIVLEQSLASAQAALQLFLMAHRKLPQEVSPMFWHEQLQD